MEILLFCDGFLGGRRGAGGGGVGAGGSKNTIFFMFSSGFI